MMSTDILNFYSTIYHHTIVRACLLVWSTFLSYLIIVFRWPPRVVLPQRYLNVGTFHNSGFCHGVDSILTCTPFVSYRTLPHSNPTVNDRDTPYSPLDMRGFRYESTAARTSHRVYDVRLAAVIHPSTCKTNRLSPLVQAVRTKECEWFFIVA